MRWKPWEFKLGIKRYPGAFRVSLRPKLATQGLDFHSQLDLDRRTLVFSQVGGQTGWSHQLGG